MSTADIKNKIAESLRNCGKEKDFALAAEALLNVLGYASSRTVSFNDSPEKFIEKFPTENVGTKTEQSFTNTVKSVCLLFQFSRHEIEEAQGVNSDNRNFQREIYDGVLFVTVELLYRCEEYHIFTREINKRLGMPTIVLFRCGRPKHRRLTLSCVDRRPNKIRTERDVLGRVLSLYEISCTDPHDKDICDLNELTLENVLQWMHEHKQEEKVAGVLRGISRNWKPYKGTQWLDDSNDWMKEWPDESISWNNKEQLQRLFDKAIGKGHVTTREIYEHLPYNIDNIDDVIDMVRALLRKKEILVDKYDKSDEYEERDDYSKYNKKEYELKQHRIQQAVDIIEPHTDSEKLANAVILFARLLQEPESE